MKRLLICAVLAVLVDVRVHAQPMRYPLPPQTAYSVRTVTYDREFKADIYRPAKSAGAVPVVVFLNGIGANWIRTHAQYTGWGSLATTVGLAGVAMDSDAADPSQSFDALLRYLKANQRELGIDAERVALYACSSNVTRGLPLILGPGRNEIRNEIRAGVIYYGSAAAIANPRLDVPLLYVRAGLDGADLNRRIDDTIASLTRTNVPVTLINYASGHHGFELFDDDEQTREIMHTTLRFLSQNLTEAATRSYRAGALKAEAAGLVTSGQPEKAIEKYRDLLRQTPDNADLHRKLADLLSATRAYREAIAEYQRALDLGDQNVGLISYGAALAALQLQDTDTALVWVERFSKVPPMRNRARSDPAFDALRSDPRFRKLIE